MPSARPHPNAIRASTASHTLLAGTGADDSNAGRSTSSVARPSASVSATDAKANSHEPATETMNGRGCIRT